LNKNIFIKIWLFGFKSVILRPIFQKLVNRTIMQNVRMNILSTSPIQGKERLGAVCDMRILDFATALWVCDTFQRVYIEDSVLSS